MNITNINSDIQHEMKCNSQTSNAATYDPTAFPTVALNVAGKMAEKSLNCCCKWAAYKCNSTATGSTPVVYHNACSRAVIIDYGFSFYGCTTVTLKPPRAIKRIPVIWSNWQLLYENDLFPLIRLKNSCPCACFWFLLVGFLNDVPFGLKSLITTHRKVSESERSPRTSQSAGRPEAKTPVLKKKKKTVLVGYSWNYFGVLSKHVLSLSQQSPHTECISIKRKGHSRYSNCLLAEVQQKANRVKSERWDRQSGNRQVAPAARHWQRDM